MGPPPSDPTAPYYGGAAVKAGSGSGEGRTRLTREGQKLDRRQVRNGDPTADKSGGSRPIERRTFRSDPDAGSKGEARKGSAGANRGDAERLLKTRYESFGVPRPSTSAIAELGPKGPRGR